VITAIVEDVFDQLVVNDAVVRVPDDELYRPRVRHAEVRDEPGIVDRLAADPLLTFGHQNLPPATRAGLNEHDDWRVGVSWLCVFTRFSDVIGLVHRQLTRPSVSIPWLGRGARVDTRGPMSSRFHGHGRDGTRRF
jgi:hypothetical protein